TARLSPWRSARTGEPNRSSVTKSSLSAAAEEGSFATKNRCGACPYAASCVKPTGNSSDFSVRVETRSTRTSASRALPALGVDSPRRTHHRIPDCSRRSSAVRICGCNAIILQLYSRPRACARVRRFVRRGERDAGALRLPILDPPARRGAHEGDGGG